MSAMQRVLATSEPVHSEIPLHGDDRPLDRLQQAEAQVIVSGNQRAMWTQNGAIMRLDPQHQADDDMADNRHDDVGRHVVGAVVKELFTADVAVVVRP